jgi:hypothetical protein
MPKKPTTTPSDQQLLERLNAHPEPKERIAAILQLAEQGEGPMRTADEIEALLIEEVRGLGSVTMQDWALGAKARVEATMKSEHPGSYRSKKNG